MARLRSTIVCEGEQSSLVGATQAGVSGETWEWDGIRWAENPSAKTQGRFNCVIAFDVSRRKVIRFGGNYQGQRFGDTWEYDATAWRQLSSTGPSARNHAAIVYDSKRDRIILVGGHDGVNVFGDTWTWDGIKWLLKESGETQKRIENGH